MDMEKRQKNVIFTIPNLLSVFRLVLIPIMVWLYIVKKDYAATTVVLALSALTDVSDGIIARKFNMISRLGTALDPIADKLTLISMLGCLVTRFNHIIFPCALLIVKELTDGIMSLIVIKKTGRVMPAVWHGKVTTFLLYTTLGVHLVFGNISVFCSDILIAVCCGFMLLSLVLYTVRNVKALKQM